MLSRVPIFKRHVVHIGNRQTIAMARHHSTDATWEWRVAASDRLVLLKSTFQAFATSIPASLIPEQARVAAWMKSEAVPRFLTHLRDVEPRTGRASHDMYAWRVRPTSTPAGSPSSAMVLYGSSNGGEAGAGERLERLLELGNCEGVILVVFRWYGGVKLGSDRWRCISSVAKEALERGGFLGGRHTEENGQKNGERKDGKGHKRRT
ncbi:hypothetical protein C8Q76DRAFT_760277 [Earliella scabrosa]|nr:hypothetical protein C8Q76DRAFT_760277 [Earliella scabrosa]